MSNFGEPSFSLPLDRERDADRYVRSASLLSAISPPSASRVVASPSAVKATRQQHRSPVAQQNSFVSLQENVNVTPVAVETPRTSTTRPQPSPSPIASGGRLTLTHASFSQSNLPKPKSQIGPDYFCGCVANAATSAVYDWRLRLPFAVPILHPELMSYDPTMYHSAVRKQVRDCGMRAVDVALLERQAQMENINLNLERGVLGMSLRKHSEDFRMTKVETYPGFARGAA